jgi:hypothetical protein
MRRFVFLTMITLILLAMVLTGCNNITSTATPATPATTTTTTTTSPAGSTVPGTPTVVTPVTTPAAATTVKLTRDQVDKLVMDFIKNSTTFKFDGMADSITFTSSEFSPISSFPAIEYTIHFQTAHPGHGDRSGQMLAQAITDHTARVYFDEYEQRIRIASCDNSWDLIKDQELHVSISGIVISGGDTAPADGPQDVPHTFVYQVKQKDGSIINVSYKSYPPSPAKEDLMAEIYLDFYAGSIQIGDRIYATGKLDKSTNTIVIAEEGGYIRTEIPKMEVIGRVISGGDTTPEGLLDAPRGFIYTIQKDDGSSIKVSYTVYPPSPAGDVKNAQITLTFYKDGIQPGDYMMACGTYDLATNTIRVADVGDLVKTYPQHP